MGLWQRRPVFAFRRLEAVTLALYTLLAGWLVYVHEPWADEAQAWLLARDASLTSILFRHEHYEGTPALWHLLLWVMTRLHLPYASMHWLSLLLGVAAVYVWLRCAPVPTVVRLALPFGFALLYQTAVVARSYSLVPLLVFLLCLELTRDGKRPIVFAVLAGLLANTALICILLSAGLAALYLVQLMQSSHAQVRRTYLPAALIWTALVLFGVYTAVPAPDQSSTRGTALAAHPAVGKLLSKVTGIPMPPMAPSVSAAAPAAKTPEPVLPHLYQRVLWRLDQHFAPHSHGAAAFNACLSLASLAFFPVSGSNLLALLFYAALLGWLWRRHSLLNLLPLLLVLLGGYVLGFNEHHTSVIWAALTATLWLSWSQRQSQAQPDQSTRLNAAFVLLLTVVLLQQTAWTAFAAVYDTQSAFDGSVDASRFIVPLQGHGTLNGYDYHSVSVQPYATHNLYANQQATFWPWSTTLDPDPQMATSLQQHPAYVLLGEGYTGNIRWANQILPRDPTWALNDPFNLASALAAHGYHETHRFCGMQPAHFGFSEKVCEVIYEPETPVAAAK